MRVINYGSASNVDGIMFTELGGTGRTGEEGHSIVLSIISIGESGRGLNEIETCCGY